MLNKYSYRQNVTYFNEQYNGKTPYQTVSYFLKYGKNNDETKETLKTLMYLLARCDRVCGLKYTEDDIQNYQERYGIQFKPYAPLDRVLTPYPAKYFNSKKCYKPQRSINDIINCEKFREEDPSTGETAF